MNYVFVGGWSHKVTVLIVAFRVWLVPWRKRRTAERLGKEFDVDESVSSRSTQNEIIFQGFMFLSTSMSNRIDNQSGEEMLCESTSGETTHAQNQQEKWCWRTRKDYFVLKAAYKDNE